MAYRAYPLNVFQFNKIVSLFIKSEIHLTLCLTRTRDLKIKFFDGLE